MSIDESSACHCDWGLVECNVCGGVGSYLTSGTETMTEEKYTLDLIDNFCHECNGTGYVACPNCALGESRRRGE